MAIHIVASIGSSCKTHQKQQASEDGEMGIGLNMRLINHPSPKLHSLLKPEITATTSWKRHAVVSSSSSTRNDEHWNFCYKTLQKVSRTFSGITLQLSEQQLRDSVCVLYLALRAVDTVEDDSEVPAEVKIPILRNFHRHIYDKDWKFICGANGDKDIMEGHHHLHSAFMDLESSSQEIIEDIILKTGEGMAKFIPREIETMNDYEECAILTNTPWIFGTSRLSQVLVGENLPPDALFYQAALLQQKSHNIHSYYEDLTDIPKRKMFCPKEIWSKYVNKLEDFLSEKNSVKAVQFVNEMVTDALRHVEDSLEFSSRIQDPSLFRFHALPRLLSMASAASCYNNIEVFRKDMRENPGVRTTILNHTRSMADVYNFYYDISCIMQSKVHNDDPHATQTRSRLESIKQKCIGSEIIDHRLNFILY